MCSVFNPTLNANVTYLVVEEAWPVFSVPNLQIPGQSLAAICNEIGYARGPRLYTSELPRDWYQHSADRDPSVHGLHLRTYTQVSHNPIGKFVFGHIDKRDTNTDSRLSHGEWLNNTISRETDNASGILEVLARLTNTLLLTRGSHCPVLWRRTTRIWPCLSRASRCQ